MKTILLTVILLFSTITFKGQNKTNNQEWYDFSYIVGHHDIVGYEPTYCSNKINIKPVIFSNGMSAPVLQYYVANKNKYAMIENMSGQKTKLKNIILIPIGNTLFFSVVGNDFSMAFTLENGAILDETETTTIFYTENVGIWKIYKNN